jgi:YegS/Rv2252/BmrU family lipid kinase
MSERPVTVRMKKIAMIVNPVSGLALGPSRREALRESLRTAGVEVDETLTEGPGHALELARDACRKGGDALLVVGGDGTVNEAVNGMALGSLPLGTFPTGTSSILARELRIPFDPRRAAGVIAAGRLRRIDVGLVNGRRFLMVVGVGWDAHVVRTVSATRRGHLGKHRYVVPIARAVIDYRFPGLTASIDGGPPRPVRLAFACNTRNYAAWFALAPGALPDDGRLDFVLLRSGCARDVLRWTWGAFTASLGRYRETTCVKGRDLLVTAETPVPFQVDGDPGGTTPVRISMDRQSLEVIVP